VYRHPHEIAFPQISTPIATLYDNFQRGLLVAHDKPFLGKRRKTIDNYGVTHFHEYQWITYQEAAELKLLIGSAFMHLNQTFLLNEMQRQWTIGIYSINRPEWTLTELAANAFSLVSVALCNRSFGMIKLVFYCCAL
jgi:long-chain acyl-CoA synthetase